MSSCAERVVFYLDNSSGAVELAQNYPDQLAFLNPDCERYVNEGSYVCPNAPGHPGFYLISVGEEACGIASRVFPDINLGIDSVPRRFVEVRFFPEADKIINGLDSSLCSSYTFRFNNTLVNKAIKERYKSFWNH